MSAPANGTPAMVMSDSTIIVFLFAAAPCCRWQIAFESVTYESIPRGSLKSLYNGGSGGTQRVPGPPRYISLVRYLAALPPDSAPENGFMSGVAPHTPRSDRL